MREGRQRGGGKSGCCRAAVFALPLLTFTLSARTELNMAYFMKCFEWQFFSSRPTWNSASIKWLKNIYIFYIFFLGRATWVEEGIWAVAQATWATPLCTSLMLPIKFCFLVIMRMRIPTIQVPAWASINFCHLFSWVFSLKHVFNCVSILHICFILRLLTCKHVNMCMLAYTLALLLNVEIRWYSLCVIFGSGESVRRGGEEGDDILSCYNKILSYINSNYLCL
jgi:hypothetical protein